MREILFKAKRIDNGKWVEGFYFCMVHEDGSHIHHFIIPLGVDLSLGTPIEKIQVEIDINTLCQYTGLTDKNGNKIWENDVVKLTRNVGYKSTKGRKFKVYFNNFLCHFALSFGQEENEAFDYMELSDKKASIIEVVGNIFDNPELLERGA